MACNITLTVCQWQFHFQAGGQWPSMDALSGLHGQISQLKDCRGCRDCRDWDLWPSRSPGKNIGIDSLWTRDTRKVVALGCWWVIQVPKPGSQWQPCQESDEAAVAQALTVCPEVAGSWGKLREVEGNRMETQYSGWWFGTCFTFPYIGHIGYFIIPTDFHIFQRDSEGCFNHQPVSWFCDDFLWFVFSASRLKASNLASWTLQELHLNFSCSSCTSASFQAAEGSEPCGWLDQWGWAWGYCVQSLVRSAVNGRNACASACCATAVRNLRLMGSVIHGIKMGVSTINHPAMGVPPFMETPILGIPERWRLTCGEQISGDLAFALNRSWFWHILARIAKRSCWTVRGHRHRDEGIHTSWQFGHMANVWQERESNYHDWKNDSCIFFYTLLS